MGAVRVKTHWGVIEPLEDIPRAEWADIVLKRGQWISNAIDYRLGKALELLAEIEQHQAWTAAGMDRYDFLRFVCRIEPDDLPRIREGYRIMRQRGEEPGSRQEALQALAGPVENGGVREAGALEGHAGPGRGHKTVDNGYRLPKGGNTVARIVARLKRDAPEVAARLAAGEFRSARAAGIAAGIVKPPSWEAQVLALWKRGTPEGRAAVYPKLRLKG